MVTQTLKKIARKALIETLYELIRQIGYKLRLLGI